MNDLLQKCRWVIRVRFIAGLVTLVSFTSIKLSGLMDFPLRIFALVPLAEMFINQPYQWIVRRTGHVRAVLFINLVIDILVITTGIHFLGGMDAMHMVVIYPLVFIFAASVMGTVDAYIMANLSFLAYLGLVLAEYYGIIPRVRVIPLELDIQTRVAMLLPVFFFFNLIAFFASFLSVQKRRLELYLEHQKQDLEKANKELDAFVYTASHDLRAPLRGISSFASFLEEDYRDKLDARGKDYLDEIRKGTERMSILIEDLLTLSRISRIQNPFEDADIKKVINAVLERLQHDIRATKAKITVPQELPTLRCDRIKITEVFANLINNGIKFASKGGKQPVIEIGYEDKEGYFQFSFKDNGIGIAPEYHEQIFEMFKRLHTQTEYEGTGAGLNIVKRVMDEHKGKVWVESREGEGATFFIMIPKKLKDHKKLGQILLDEGIISKVQLESTLKKQEEGEDVE